MSAKLSEAALPQAARERSNAAADSLAYLDVLPVLVWRSGRDARCDYFNQAWLDFTGRRLDQELGDGWAEAVHPDDRERCVGDYLEAFEARKPFSLEYRLRRNDGEYRWVRDVGRPYFTAGGEFSGYIGGCIDVTDRAKAEEALRLLASRLNVVREEERRSIALNLHDELGQALTSAKIDLSLLEQAMRSRKGRPSGAHILRELRSAKRTVDKALGGLRRIAAELRPAVLNELGLAPAIEWLVKDFERHARIKCRVFMHDGFHEPDKERSTALYRILQEALTNITRHAAAKTVRIELAERERKYVLEIRDDGVGIPDHRLSDWGSLGLTGMRERALAFHGQVSIDRGPGGGTTVMATIPKAAEPPEAA
jgi:two-component system sensor histidine kinase UhpB